MKSKCEKCDRKLASGGEACICSYECTFCRERTEAMSAVYPNCGGELAKRPRKGNASEQLL
jgi:hypothetical protein